MVTVKKNVLPSVRHDGAARPARASSSRTRSQVSADASDGDGWIKSVRSPRRDEDDRHRVETAVQ